MSTTKIETDIFRLNRVYAAFWLSSRVKLSWFMKRYLDLIKCDVSLDVIYTSQGNYFPLLILKPINHFNDNCCCQIVANCYYDYDFET